MPRARKSKAAGTTARAAAATVADPEAKLIEAALDLAARQGWRNTSLGAIAREAKLPLAEAYRLHRSKASLLGAFFRNLDRTVLAAGEPSGAPRDRLFELLMRRFDALKPRKQALRAIARDSIGDPRMLCRGPGFFTAMAWMLEAAGISAVGWRGPLRVAALAGAYLLVFPTFLADESEDLAKTMAALDGRLKAGPWQGDPTEAPSAS
jgi:AcrR family transcriptional regulator